MIVVSNTSPIINLARIGQLDLLRQLYDRVVIPEAVYHEIVVEGVGQAGADAVPTLTWIEARPVTDRALVTTLRADLDAGEAEAIALALELSADLLLLDERRGYAIAHRLGQRSVGLLAVLIEAKQHGYVSAIKPIIDALMVHAGFWISRALYRRVLDVAGE